MYPLKQDHRPLGGWKWEVHGKTFEGDTLSSVLSKVGEFRSNNLLPKGNLMEEFREYAWTKWPDIFDTTLPPVPPRKEKKLSKAIYQSLFKLKGMPIDPRGHKDRDAAVKACKDCPFFDDEMVVDKEYRDAVVRLEAMLSGAHGIPRRGIYCTFFGTNINITSCESQAHTAVPARPDNPQIPAGCHLRVPQPPTTALAPSKP